MTVTFNGEGTLFVADGKSGNVELEEVLIDVFEEYFELWQKKQASYGSGNIAAFGELGCLIRGYDKIQRLRKALYDGQENTLEDEKLEDTWLDLLGYAAMGLMTHRGLWPK